ncbi:MAG: lysophospholipid acyltransferase family protein [Caldilineaceae bacterium]
MRFLQALVFLLVVRPLLMVVIGLNVRGRERLPEYGPAIIAANHNSHLDTLTLMALWPLRALHRIHPAAAADYFLSNPILAWLSLNIMGIIPVDRNRTDRTSDPLADMGVALEREEILILFPEGSRGEPEQLSRFKTGVARLAERHPQAPIVPVFMHGLGKSLPRGDFLLVPFFADIVVGEPVYWQGSIQATMDAYQRAMNELSTQVVAPAWE